MRAKSSVILSVIVSMLGFGACAAPSGRTTPADAGMTYSGRVERLIIKRCEGCHDAEKAKGQLVLDPGTGYDNLVGRASTRVPDVVLVRPGDPDGSLLWQKLNGTAREGKGMPLTPHGWKKLPEKELELIRAWIADGARP